MISPVKPVKAGLDPINKLIDRNPSDKYGGGRGAVSGDERRPLNWHRGH
ncbi:MAG: hypothetical protein H0W83_14925 [Planctomycetes bacterium]|nr:hypothetical protein [Planctomycetota bacterium]